MAERTSKLKEDIIFDELRMCVVEYRNIEPLLDRVAALSYQFEKLEDAATRPRKRNRHGVHYVGCCWASDTARCGPDTCPCTDSAVTCRRVGDAMRAIVSMLRPDAEADHVDVCSRLRRCVADIHACIATGI
jgi:hypothetical protein